MYKDFVKTNKIWCWVEDGQDLKFTTYTVNNMVAGDTDSGYFSIADCVNENSNVDDVVTFADEIGKLTNESFPDFVMKAFNCPEERKDIIKTDREAVSDKSLFLTKKRYIMHVVDSEGNRVDKLKIMGVEIKKSDTSDALKKILMDLVKMILDGYSKEDVFDAVDTMKEKFYTMPVHEIAKPISVKTLKKCQDMYKMTGSMKGFPYQVRAAMFYNSLCGITDKMVYPGEKVGLVYIKHPKSNYIAFPIDSSKLPNWWEKEIVIDYKTEWAKAHKKIINYLSSLDWDFKSIKDNKKKELFGF